MKWRNERRKRRKKRGEEAKGRRVGVTKGEEEREGGGKMRVLTEWRNETGEEGEVVMKTGGNEVERQREGV